MLEQSPKDTPKTQLNNNNMNRWSVVLQNVLNGRPWHDAMSLVE